MALCCGAVQGGNCADWAGSSRHDTPAHKSAVTGVGYEAVAAHPTHQLLGITRSHGIWKACRQSIWVQQGASAVQNMASAVHQVHALQSPSLSASLHQGMIMNCYCLPLPPKCNDQALPSPMLAPAPGQQLTSSLMDMTCTLGRLIQSGSSCNS